MTRRTLGNISKCSVCVGLAAFLSLVTATETEMQKADPAKPTAKAEAPAPADAKAAAESDDESKDTKADGKAAVPPAVGTLEDIFGLGRLDLAKLDAKVEPKVEPPQVIWQEAD